MKYSFLVVGAGFSGATLARQLVTHLDCSVKVIDKRSHIAGNCYTHRDHDSGIMLHQYGPHIFNTNHEHVWNYINRFGSFYPFVNRVKASIPSGVYSLPINLLTINQFFNKRLNPSEAQAFIASLGDKTIQTAMNFEERALQLIGPELYEAFFKGYTIKQWGIEPREIPASVLNRLPVRFNYDDNYYNAKYQGIPFDGYTALIEKMFTHAKISVELGVAYEPSSASGFDHVFYTGPIDAYFDYSLGYLSYRTVEFEPITGVGDLQGNAVINYPEITDPFTRIHEHKHFAPFEQFEKTIAFKEFSRKTMAADEPYYPVRMERDKMMLRNYYQKVKDETIGVSFLGRLGTYRYLDMDDTIHEALAFSDQFIAAWSDTKHQLPQFSFELSNRLNE